MANELDTALSDAASRNLSHSDMLDRLVDLEIDGRQSLAIQPDSRTRSSEYGRTGASCRLLAFC